MTDKVLEKYISQVIALEPTKQVTLAWQGGEPTLLGIDFYRKAANLATKYLPKGKKIQWTIQTNGVLLDNEWCDFFRQNQYLVGVSLDGPRDAHNAYRRDSFGKGTFNKVIRGIQLLKKHKVDFNILCCVHSANGDRGLEVYRFLRDNLEVRYVQFIPVVERSKNGQSASVSGHIATSRSVRPIQWGEFLIDVFDEWVHHDVGKVFVMIFDWTLSSWLGIESPACIFQQRCGHAPILEHNGRLYCCDHFVNDAHFIGDISISPLTKVLASKKQIEFGERKAYLPKYCQKCSVRFACNGECPKNRFIRSPDGESGLNYLCEGYKRYFTYVDKPMKIMASLISLGRLAEEIMSIQY